MLGQAQWQMNLDRQQELLKVAANQRLLRQARPAVTHSQNNLFINVANFLISSGMWLKTHYQPVMH
jgi:hypothetical protein